MSVLKFKPFSKGGYILLETFIPPIVCKIMNTAAYYHRHYKLQHHQHNPYLNVLLHGINP